MKNKLGVMIDKGQEGKDWRNKGWTGYLRVERKVIRQDKE
jgi:hypothetical protein